MHEGLENVITILIDSREQAPYSFAGLMDDISLVTTALTTGDYRVPFVSAAVSRKSLADLFSTILCAERRHRFTEELDRLSALEHALVVVEGMPWEYPESTATQRLVVRNKIARWQEDYPRVLWQFCAGRRDAEIATLDFLRWCKLESEMTYPTDPTNTTDTVAEDKSNG